MSTHGHVSPSFPSRQFGKITWLLSLVVVFIGISYPHMNKGLLTRAWQAGVIALGGIVVAKSFSGRWVGHASGSILCQFIFMYQPGMRQRRGLRFRVCQPL